MTQGEAMRQARLAHGLSLEALSELSGVSWVHIGRMERGTHFGKVSTLQLLADALGISVRQYIGLDAPDDAITLTKDPKTGKFSVYCGPLRLGEANNLDESLNIIRQYTENF